MARLRAQVLAALLVAAAASPALSQGEAPVMGDLRSQIATIQPDQLFARTAYGQAMQARGAEAANALQEENRRIETALEAEERALTDRRRSMAPEAFRTLAEAFDTKVEGIRTAQEAKSRTLKRQAEEDRQRFFETALPVLADLMGEIGAVALLDKAGIVLSLEAIDITDRAVARIDAVLGDGSSLETGAAVQRSQPGPSEPVPAP